MCLRRRGRPGKGPTSTAKRTSSPSARRASSTSPTASTRICRNTSASRCKPGLAEQARQQEAGMKRLVVAALGCIIAVTGTAFAGVSDPVKIDSGLVSGAPGTNSSVQSYKGIPFAAPPTGDNRWRAPQPAAKWDGVRKADTFGAPCIPGPAPAGRGGGGGRGAAPGAPATAAPAAPRAAAPPAAGAPAVPREPARGEDCLYLNVWTSAKGASDRRPVMVWIYGGGFTGRSGGMAWYDGENLASKGPVIVTLNYRLGSLGFLAHPDLAKEAGHTGSGNYGMMDAIAALQWVKRNIAAFGGDPNNVTVA